MGRKSHEKKQRRQQEQAKPQAGTVAAGAGGGFGWIWLVAVVAVVGGLVVFGIRYYQANQSRLLQAALQVSAAAVENKLNASRSRLPYETAGEMAKLCGSIRVMSMHPKLDTRAAGQLRFVLGAMEEMIRDGNVQPEEIGKLRNLVFQIGGYLQRSAAATSKP